MSLEVDSLYWQARIEYSKIQADINAIKGQMGTLSGQADKVGRDIDKSFNDAFKKAGGYMAAYFTFDQFTQLGSSLITVRGEFEKYNAVLANAYGSQSIAAEKMAMLQQTAMNLPASLSQITESFIKLKNGGMEPTQEMLVTLTDMASSQGKSLDMYVEALKDAKTFQYERLREFGITAATVGDKVTFSFKNQKIEVDKNAQSIENYLIGLGKMEGIAGSSAAIMQGLEGMISNLGDAWDRMLNDIGQSNDGIIKSGIGGLTDLVNNYQEVLKIVAGLAAVYGTYRAALILTNTVQAASAAINEVVAASAGMVNAAQARQIIVNNAVATSWKGLTATLMANPFVAIATAIAALVAALYLFKEEVNATTISAEILNKKNNDLAVAVNKETNAYNSLTEAIKKTKPHTDERATAIKNLTDRYGNLLPNVNLLNLSEADLNKVLNKGNKELKERITLTEKQNQLDAAKADTQAAKANYDIQYQRIFDPSQNKYFSNQGLERAKKHLAELQEIYFAKRRVETQLYADVVTIKANKAGIDPITGSKIITDTSNNTGNDKKSSNLKVEREAAREMIEFDKKIREEINKNANEQWKKLLDRQKEVNAEYWKNEEDKWNNEVDAHEKSQAAYGQLIESLRTYEQQRLAITNDYADKREQLIKNSATESELAILNTQETESLAALNKSYNDHINSYAEMVDEVRELRKQEIIDAANRANALIETDATLNEAQKKLAHERVNNLKNAVITENDLSVVNAYANAVGQLGNSFMGINNTLGSTMQYMADIALTTTSLIKASKEAKGSTAQISGTISGIAGIIGLVLQGVMAIANWFKKIPDSAKKYTEELERQQKLLEIQSILRDREVAIAEHNGDQQAVYDIYKNKYDAQEAIIKEAENEIKKQKKITDAAYNEQLKPPHNRWFWEKSALEDYEDASEKLTKMEEHLAELQKNRLIDETDLLKEQWKLEDAKKENAQKILDAYNESIRNVDGANESKRDAQKNQAEYIGDWKGAYDIEKSIYDEKKAERDKYYTDLETEKGKLSDYDKKLYNAQLAFDKALAAEKSARESYDKAITAEEIDAAERQVFATTSETTRLAKELDVIKNNPDSTQTKVNNLQASLTTADGQLITLGDNVDRAKKKWDEMTEAEKKAYNEWVTNNAKKRAEQIKAIKEAEIELFKRLTGTTAQNLSDSILQGLRNGENAVTLFGKKMNDVFTNAILQSFQMKYIEPVIDKIMKKGENASLTTGYNKDYIYRKLYTTAEADGNVWDFNTQSMVAGKSGTITQSGIDYNKYLGSAAQKENRGVGTSAAEWTAIINDSMPDIEKMNVGWQGVQEALKSITPNGLNNSNQQGLQGAIKGQLTEDTGSLLAGQFNGLRMTAVQQLEMATAGLAELQKISSNTYHLIEIKDLIKANSQSTNNALRSVGL